MPSVHELAARWLSLDEVCDRFEEACLAGSRPKIEDFLANVPTEHRLETVRELLKVDAFYRRKEADEPSVAEYRGRFPELDSAWLRTMLSPPSRSGSPSQSSITAKGWSAIDPFKLPKIAGYEVLELIGRGGMGVVYKARQISLNRLVALKMVLAGDMAGPETLARFRAEARAAAQLQHPNLVQIFEVGEHEGRPFLSFEFIEGGGLDQRLRGIPQLPKPSARLIKELAHAVQFAHSRSIVHRDLKPANVLLAQHERSGSDPDSTFSEAPKPSTRSSTLRVEPVEQKQEQRLDSESRATEHIDSDCSVKRRLDAESQATEFGFPKISDFGLAKHLDEDVLQTKTGVILGTPSYMAPEQATGKPDSVGPAADIYSLGAIMYEMLTGRPPFRAPTVVETLDQLRSQEPITLRRIQPTIPRDLETICLKCLQKDPAKRYESAGALADDLDRYLRDEHVLARPVGTRERIARWCVRRPLAASLIALLFFVTLGGVSGIAWQWREAASQRELANDNAARFRSERDVAQQQRSLANENAERAAKNQRDAEAAQLRAERSSYFHRIGQAQGEWFADHVGRADQLLDECLPEMRGWEWSYLKSQCHSELRTMLGHSNEVLVVAFSPDGKTIASGSGQWGRAKPGEVKLWDAESGTLRATLRGHNGPIMGVAFSPDGQKLVSAATGWEGVREAFVKVWSVSGEELFTLPAVSSNAFGAAFSPDGRQLAIAGADGPIRFWDATSGEPLPLTLTGHTGYVFEVHFSPDGKLLLSVGRDGAVRIWSLATGKQEFAQTGYNDLRCASFSPDGRFVAFSGFGNELWIWDFAKSGDIPASGAASAPRLDRDQSTSSQNRGADAAPFAGTKTGDKPTKYSYDIGVISSLEYSPEGRRLAVSSRNGRVLVISPVTGAVLKQFHTHDGTVRSVAFSPDGRVLVTGGVDRAVKTWDARTDWNAEVIRVAAVNPAKTTGFFYRMAVSPDGKRLLLPSGFNRGSPGNGEKTLLSLDLETSQVVQTCRGHTGWLNDVSVSRDGSRYATASDDKTARIWNAETGKEERKLLGHAAAVTSVCFHPNGEQLATACADGTIRLWDRSTGEPVRNLLGHEGRVTLVRFDSTGERLVSAGEDHTVRVWDVSDSTSSSTLRVEQNAARLGESSDVLRGHTGSVRAVAFSPDDRWIASASDDETVRLWDVRRSTLRVSETIDAQVSGVASAPRFSAEAVPTGGLTPPRSPSLSQTLRGEPKAARLGESSYVWRGHRGGVTDVTFSSDGKRVGSCGLDMTVKLWDIESGEEAISLRDATGSVLCMAFHPDGQQIFGIHEWRLRIWNAKPQPSPKTEEDFVAASDNWHDVEGWKYARSKQFAAAVFHFEQMTKRHPERANLHAHVADNLAELGEWARAKQSFETAAMLDPNDFSNFSGIALTEFQLGNIEAYRQACAKYRSMIQDKTPAALVNKAVWYSLLVPDTVADPQELVTLGLRAVALANNAERGLHTNRLGGVFLRANQLDLARTTLNASLTFNANFPLVEDWLFLALTEARAGNKDKALEWLAKAEAWLADPPKTLPNGKPFTPPWWDRVAWDMLLKEAKAKSND